MANYCCATRTNYFRVKDPDAFRVFMKKVCTDEGRIDIWEEKNENNDTVFGFGAYGAILGVGIDWNQKYGYFEDYDYEEFVDGLSKIVADDDAIIIMESGNEKLRYLVGAAQVITSRKSEYIDVDAIAVERAAKMLNNPSWKTTLTY